MPLGEAELHSIGSAFLFLSAYGATRAHLRVPAIVVLACVISFCPEYAQSLFGVRIFEWADVGMNSLGVGLGAVIVGACYRIGWVRRI